MGRSKFPGKPPKTVTRKRIKVLGQSETIQSDSVTVAENIYYGLSLFNETFGDNEKEHPPFHGFSTKEASLSASYIKTQQQDAGNSKKKLPSTGIENVIPQSSKEQATELAEDILPDNKNDPVTLHNVLSETVEVTTKEVTLSNSKRTSKVNRPKSRKNCKNIKFSSFMKTPVLKSVKNILDQHQRTRQLRNSTAKRLLQRAKSNNSNAQNMRMQSSEKSSAVRKFVLPIRSAHSSRVIKPNKRFIEELEEISSMEHNENEVNVHIKKAKVSSGKLEHQESKLKEGGVHNLCPKLKDKELRYKAKKATRQTGSDTHESNQLKKNCEKADSPIRTMQISKTIRKDAKAQILSNKNTSAEDGQCDDSDARQSSQNLDSLNGVAQNARQNTKLSISRSPKQISTSTQDLPYSDVPFSESSKVQTRSGTLSDGPSAVNVVVNNEENFKLCNTSGLNNQEHCSANKSTEGNVEDLDTESTSSESGSEHSNHTEDEQSEWSGIKLSGGKVILRKARLKLDNKCIGGTEGPFSTTTNNTSGGMSNLGLTGTIKCGVCGAVRFYRFVKQARKFGIHSCESCRKFISKMIKRQNYAKSTNTNLPVLQCHKGDGLCLVPPVVRSQQWNLMRCVYKARCPACWLKMCLKCYNIPSTLRTGLNMLLPPMMRHPLSIPLCMGQEESENQGQRLASCKIRWPADDSLGKNLFKSAITWKSVDVGQKSSYQNTTGFLHPKIDKFDLTSNISPSKKRRKDNRIKVRKKIKNPTFSPSPIEQSPQPLRQRLELKGPRVKHVCRSASVALGQPIATFPITEGKDCNENKHIPRTTKENDRIGKNEESVKENELQKNNEENNIVQNLNTNQQSHPKRGKPQQHISTSNLPTTKTTNTVQTVCIDFWEQYDPVEVGTKGFALIGSELFHISAICFLCGSAGKEPLIHCQCCCEPYHVFCLEPSEWNACTQPNWSCPRCTVCQSCHVRSGPKLCCIRCRQSFHHSCLLKSGVSVRLYSPDRPYVCQSCIKCKSCGSEGVNVYVGNLPLCSMCFKLRQRGNYCPLCQKCYNENDFDSKMMECSECSCWVHARCEGLSDERYQILSHLPDSIEFTCHQCSADPNSAWRNAIEAELKAGFISVIKSLSKNRKACAALKWSPRKECLCRPISSVRKLDFSEENMAMDITNGKKVLLDESEECTSERSGDTDSNSSTKMENMNRIYFEEQVADGSNRRGLRRLRQKFHLKECSVRVKNCVPKDIQETDKKDSGNQEHMSNGSNDIKECNCSDQQVIVRPSPTLMSVKRKVNGNEYKSLSQFHCDMEHVISRAGMKDLIESYHKILKEVFPWFTTKNCKTFHETDGMQTPTRDDYNNTEHVLTRFDDFNTDIWRKERLKAPKTIGSKTLNLYNAHIEDSRSCCLCKGLGDGQETREGRLLYCGQNEWVHANCALWSNEVFEEIDGSLQNVHNAISKGRLIRCTECGKKGASISCCTKNCSNTYHFSCARNIGLAFNEDKTVFCSLHLSSNTNKVLQNEMDFCLKRPVYVELDRKKKKYAEPNKVKVMIGSLLIDNLGGIIPKYSDSAEKITPCEYKCSRLYWSTVNPFKIVRYYIRTYVQVYVPDASPNVENNITIDHSEERQKTEALSDSQKCEDLAVKQTLDTLIDSVCAKEVEEQNNTDFLPPELKEAIFEDLPHDLLDGISMQDIFPKVSYEDFLGMDLKNDGAFTSDLLKEDILPSEVEEMIKPAENKPTKLEQSLTELGSQNDFWVQVESKSSVQDLMDDLFHSKNQKRGGRELKRSKSEVLSNSSLIVGAQRHQQRSCSLTWSCKLDSNYTPNIKRRKVPRNPSTSKPNDNSVTVTESQNVRSSVFHELRIPENIMVTVGRSSTSNIISDTVRELKCSREDAKEHKRLFWQARQQPRILQVDGPADVNSASECSSPEYNTEERSAPLHPQGALSIPQLDGINDESLSESNDSEALTDNGSRSLISSFSQAKRILGFIRSRVASNGDQRSEQKSNPLKNNNLKLSLEIPQLDGAGDISSDDEYVSPPVNGIEKTCNIPQCDVVIDHADRPVTCKRCRCTYRTQDSYNRHLTNCDIMVTSDSDSETMDNKLASPDSRFSPSIGSVSPQFITLSPSEGHTLSSDYSDIQATSPIEASIPSPHPGMQIEPIAQAIITPQIHTHATVETVHQTVLTSNDMIVQTQYTRTTTTLPNAAVLPQESSVQITEITDPPTVMGDSGVGRNIINVPLSSPDSSSSQTVPSPQVSPTFSSTGVQTAANNDASHVNALTSRVAKAKSPRAPKPRAKGIKSQVIKNVVRSHNGQVRFQPLQNTTPLIQLQQTQRQNGPTVILQQVASPNIMSAYVETLQQQSGQNLQYIAALGGQHEAGFKPQFITTNQLVPGAYIQAPTDNLLALQSSGISILPSVQIAQTQPTVLGTIIQQQPSAIQCGVISSEQLLLSSTPTLEMFTDSAGSMFVSNQPMYYGLETIVSNTVMSSSQFMAGAVPQVLASSYQTTTQVFQASKLMEPIVDVQAVSTVPTVATVPAVQSMQGVSSVTSVPNGPTVPTVTGISNIPSIPSMPNVPNVPSGYVVLNQTTPMAESIATPRMNISVAPEPNFTPVTCDPVSSTACQPIVETVAPIRIPDMNPVETRITSLKIPSPSKSAQQPIPTIPKVAVRPSPVSQSAAQSNTESWKITEPLFGTEQPMNNSIRPYFDSKHVSENTSMIKSSISSKIPPLPNHCITPRNVVVNNKLNHDVNNVHNSYSSTVISSTNVNVSTNSSPVITSANVQTKITMSTNNVPTSRPMNRVLPMQAVTPKQDPTEALEKSEMVIEEPTKPVIKAAEPEPMEPKRPIVKAVEPVKKTETDLKDTNDIIKLNSDSIAKVKENLKLEIDKDKVQNTSLKIVLQKQLQDGSYKITHNMKAVTQNKKPPQVTSVEILPSKQVSQIASLQLLPIKTFTLKTNKIDENVKPPDIKTNILKTKTPPIAVKKPRITAKTLKPVQTTPPNNRPQKLCSGRPSLMYEIKSQDGFTHTASSMTEVWETVFQAVQNARKAHNLPPLPHNPLSENLGLENNATVYLVEQLPGVNKCTKYKPKFHNLTPPKPGEVENDLPTECDNGTARAEPFKGRKVHDMFSWLASRHRQQPKMIAISEAESRQRVASTNLPMAMRFRILKETSKESVGVYHSHIHGRGLFCLRDIEAGEMVIEYAGEVIRASLTDKREKYYDSKNIGCYMFKIDDHLVVDATMKGNAARFINHSCEPNCYSRVVDILGKKHILIFALRRIVQGEELTYDYKFPFEDIKIPCTCGSRRCRKYLN